MDPNQYQQAYPVGQPIPMPGQPAGAAQPASMNGQMNGQLDPQTVQAILQLQQQGPQQAAITKQMQQAQALRGQFAPESPTGVMGAQGGNLRVGAPNYLGAVGQLLAAYKANQMDDDASVKQKNLGVEKNDAMRRYYEALTQQRGSPSVGYMGEEGE